MSQDQFTLTPQDVRAQEFARALRGYDRLEVDAFRTRVADELERLLRERAQFEERARNAQEQLRAFRERERAMNDALLAAQQLRHDAQAAAARDAGMVMREAALDAEKLVERSRVEERLVRERAETAARQFSAYVAAFRLLLERQLAELDVLESHSQTIVQLQGEAIAAARLPAEDAA
jgi:DivIVA domain-containing protein